ncbi:mannose/cellobiose epimerase-like protein (N-acyl-D-glucosamine 2-epimerase family) [Pseudomonas duriflava]|uniref:Mannose/cellobiose epimerase-like protein (N-acyl-D-glucosamine 2-epimerase family) n=1 Tax=Pseudomonas duriflava TaxID=459528 RepID=A0A562Q7Y1_9PSED|nr:AGE family epimerase/isomerase [Pseudomonas duriflava]TWI52804.1 mannose/cellobiose epimerase-like protein (N-acyl-D-glucosamine 2-epimerase family) [Pseudomonas duriflava]
MSFPDFHQRETLLDHIRATLAFYVPRCIDERGGFFHFFRDNGDIYDRETRHLVSSTRFVFNFAMAYRQFGNREYLDATYHGLRYLREKHLQPNGSYAWLLRGDEILDGTNHAYGLAFVILAYAHGVMAGVEDARAWLAETWDTFEQHFWREADGLYCDEISPDWSEVSSYRGQNANMHACEALLAAFEATGEQRYLDRAETLALNMTQRQAALTKSTAPVAASVPEGLIWEHYHADWSIDWDYNRDDPANLFRPWGFQPGHQVEWAKLLLILERHRPLTWLAPRAAELFDAAWQNAWDIEHGGLYYGFAPDGSPCDPDKYFWVQAEALAAAALLAARTGEERYWKHYDQLWQYSWEFFIDHEYGAWWRLLDRRNRKYSDEKSPAGKVDYHTMGACYEVLNVLP